MVTAVILDGDGPLSIAGGTWQLNSPHFLTLGSEAVLCCEPVLGDLWIGLGNKMIVLDTHMLTFQVRETVLNTRDYFREGRVYCVKM